MEPFEQGRSLVSQLTARRLNDLQRAIRPVRFSGQGAKISHLAGQTIITIRKNKGGAGIPPITGQYIGSDFSDADSGKVVTSYGTHNNFAPLANGLPLLPPLGMPAPRLALDDGAEVVYAQFDFSWDATMIITMEDGSLNSSDSTTPTTTLTFAPDGSGSGTYYQTLYAVSVHLPSSPGGNYSVTIQQNITTSQSFVFCGQALIA